MGSSILTNRSAMTALQTLKTISSKLDKTQNRVSTGLKIGEAADNIAYWSISSMMKTDSGTLSAVSDAMDLGLGQVNTAYEAVSVIKTYLDEISKSLATAYGKSDADTSAIITDINSKLENIKTAVESANIAGKNILTGSAKFTGTPPAIDTTTKEDSDVKIAGSYRREGTTVTVDMITVGSKDTTFAHTDGTNFDYTQGVLSDLFGNDNNTATALGGLQDFLKLSGSASDEQVKAALDSVTEATAKVLTAGSKLGASKTQVQGQIDFVGKLVDSIDSGVGALVDADMNAESARLSALQTQQQLSIQSLSIANQSAQNILSLFQN